MKWLTLQQIKQQLRIEPDFDEEDDLLTMYGDSAEETILNVCNRTVEDIFNEYGRIPQPLVHASLLLVSASYEHRSPVTQYQLYAVKYSFDLMVKKYMKLT